MIFMKRQKKKYESPFRPWDKNAIEREREIVKRFGLKRKKEIRMAEGVLRKYRRMAREVAATQNKEKESILVNKVVGLGLLPESATLDSVLSLSLENLLQRRLQTVLKEKGMANTMHQSRQLITHGHVKIGNKKIIYPSYVVTRAEEGSISVDLTLKAKSFEVPVAVVNVEESEANE